MLIRFFFGLSQSPTYPASARGVSVWINPSFQGRANGIIIASIGIGSAIAPPLVSAVMLNWGWRAAMLVSVVPALLAALLLLRLKEPANINAPAGSHSSDSSPDLRGKGSLKSPAFILLTISYTLQGYVGYIFVTWFYIYLVQERKFSLLGGAWMSSLPWILSIISIPLGGFLSDRLVKSNAGEKWGRRVIPITGMVLSGIMISIGAHTLNPVTAAITLALATALILCVEGPFWTTMISVSGGRSGTAGGIMNTGSNIGGLISPVITPFIASVTGWENALHIAALLAVAGGLLWFWIKPEDRI
jgi:ACS family glucarate transporter-like MFS transporter